MELASYVVLAILSVLVAGKQFHGPFEVMRRFLVPLVGVTALVWWWFTGASLNLSLGGVWLVAGMVSWWIITTLMSPHKHLGMGDLSVWIGTVTFVVFGFTDVNTTGLMIVMVGVVANCVYAIVQHEFKYEPFWKLKDDLTHAPVGFVGNTNMLGNFLTINFFLALYLANHGYWWFMIVCALIVYTIWLTRCKGSYVGIVTGIVTTAIMGVDEPVYTFVVLTVTFILLMGLLKRHNFINAYNKATAKDRLRYLQVAWEQIKHSPIFGVGFDGLKCNEPFLQRDINIRMNGKFLDPNNYAQPYPQKCHNDYVQMVCDVGIPGLVMYVGLIVLALLSPADPTLKGGLVAALTTGLFLHNLHLTPTSIWTWFVLFLCLHSYDAVGVSVPWYVVGLLATILLATYRDVINATLSSFWYQQYRLTKDVTNLHKALAYTPYDGHVLTHLGGAHQIAREFLDASDYATKAVCWFDGAIRIWELCLNVAKSQLTLGGLLLAEHYAKQSLSFNPNYADGETFLAQIQTILQRGYQVRRTPEVKNESKTNGA